MSSETKELLQAIRAIACMFLPLSRTLNFYHVRVQPFLVLGGLNASSETLRQMKI